MKRLTGVPLRTEAEDFTALHATTAEYDSAAIHLPDATSDLVFAAFIAVNDYTADIAG